MQLSDGNAGMDLGHFCFGTSKLPRSVHVNKCAFQVEAEEHLDLEGNFHLLSQTVAIGLKNPVLIMVCSLRPAITCVDHCYIRVNKMISLRVLRGGS